MSRFHPPERLPRPLGFDRCLVAHPWCLISAAQAPPRQGGSTMPRCGFPSNHRDITSTVGRPMAPRRRGWRARRLSGCAIGRVLSSPPSDGSTAWGGGLGSPLSVRTADATPRGPVRRVPRPQTVPVGPGGWRPPSAAWGAAVRPAPVPVTECGTPPPSLRSSEARKSSASARDIDWICRRRTVEDARQLPPGPALFPASI